MPLIIEGNNNELKAIIQGELDHHNSAEIRKGIDENIERLRPKKLKIDFSQVTFMDSSGIGLIMGRYNTMQLYGGEIEVDNPSPSIEKILKISGIEKLARIVKKEEEQK